MTDLKDSGVYWLGEIPKDWALYPAWALFREGKGKSTSDDDHLIPSRVYGVITQAEYREITGHKTMANEATADNMKHVEPNDFIISMGSHETGIEHSRISGKVSNDYRVLRPTSLVNPEFYKYFLKSKPFIDGLNGLTTEIRVGQRIHYSRFALLKIPLPDPATQRSIADYLDNEISEMDARIEEFERLVRELEVRKLLLPDSKINHQGASMPTVPAKLLTRITTGDGDTQDAIEDGEFPFYVRSDIVRASDKWTFEGPAVLTSGDGAGVGKIFHFAEGKFRAHQRVYVLRSFKGVDPKYFYWCFRTNFPRQVEHGGAKATVESVRMNMVADTPIPLPPLDKQREIAEELDHAFEKMDALIEESTTLVENLKARKTALITEVVTGRKEV